MGRKDYLLLLLNLEQSHSLKECPTSPILLEVSKEGTPHFESRESERELRWGKMAIAKTSEVLISPVKLYGDSYFLPSAFLQLPNFSVINIY